MVRLQYDHNNERYHLTIPRAYARALDWKSGDAISLNINKGEKTITLVRL